MSKKAFLILTILIAVLSFTGWFKSSANKNIQSQKLISLLKFDIDSVHKIQINSKDTEIIIEEIESGKWINASAHSYPADNSKISETLIKLADCSSSQIVTSNPANFEKLGFGLPDQTSISLKDSNDKEIAELLSGKKRENSEKTPYSEAGRYVKSGSNNTVYLLSNDIDISLENKEWLDTAIVDIKSSDIQKIILLKTSPSLNIIQKTEQPDEKKNTGQNEPVFELKGYNLTDTVKSWGMNQITGAFSTLNLADVYSSGSKTVSSLKFEKLLILHTTGNLIYTFSGVEDQGKFFLKVLTHQDKEKNPDSLKKKIELLNQNFTKWVYHLESWDAAMFNKKYEDLVEVPEEKKEDNDTGNENKLTETDETLNEQKTDLEPAASNEESKESVLNPDIS